MTVSSKYSDTIIPDHSLAGLSVEEGNSEAAVSKLDIACLLFVYIKLRKKRLPISIFGQDYYLELTFSNETLALLSKLPKPTTPDFKAVKRNGLKAEMESNGWLDLASEIINIRVDSGFKSPPLFVEVYPDKRTDDRNSTFSFYFNRSGNRYFMNASCAPTQVLLGQNSLPVAVDFGRINADRLLRNRAKFLVHMFCLPFVIAADLVEQYVYKRYASDENNLRRQVGRGRIVLQKVQLAAYSQEFASTHERNLALAALYQTLGAKLIHSAGKAKSANVAESFNAKFEDSKSTAHYEKDANGNEALVVSGFMLRQSYGHKPSYSLGFYAKDKVQREDMVEITDRLILYYQEPRNSNKDSWQEVINATERSIRLDLSVHTEGLRLLSKHLHKLYPDIPAVETTTADNIEKLFYALLKQDESLGIVFRYVLQRQFRFDQLFGTTAKQWRMAWDYLKELGHYDLIDALKNRSDNFGQGSFTALVKKHCPKEDPSRLRRNVQLKTALFNSDGTESTPGVDLQFPYRAVQLVRRRMQEMYEDPDAIEQLYEEGQWPNDYDAKDIARQARAKARKIHLTLLQGGINNMPCLSGIKISIL